MDSILYHSYAVLLREWSQNMAKNQMGAVLTERIDTKQKSWQILDHQFKQAVTKKSQSFNSSGYSSLSIR